VTRIGLFGGSFDPPHLAHLALARLALAQLRLDRLLWLPAGEPWQKSGRGLAAAVHRVAMLKLMIDGEPRFVLDERELKRSGPSYTIDSVQELRAEYPGAELFLVIGQDQYARLTTWHRWQALLPMVTPAVAARGGKGALTPPDLAAAAHGVVWLHLPEMPQASTTIRGLVARGQDCSVLAGEPVARYIDRHHLYREGTAP
jgi:nicotinate-nucleotide adenylyltransferase